MAILIVEVLLFAYSGFFFRGSGKMAYVSDFLEPFIGAGLFSLISFGEEYKDFYKFALVFVIAIFILAAIAAHLVEYNGVELRELKKSRRAEVIDMRMDKVARCSLVLAGIASIIIMSAIRIDKNIQYFSEVDPYYIEENEEIAVMFDRDRWDSLSDSEKLEILQIVANCETTNSDLGFTVRVTSGDLGERILGTYCNDFREVTIDIDNLREGAPGSLLKTVIHEVHHAWEYNLIDRYYAALPFERDMDIYEPVEDYEREFGNYTEYSSSSRDEYYYQRVEVDAREYAEMRLEDYMEYFMNRK